MHIIVAVFLLSAAKALEIGPFIDLPWVVPVWLLLFVALDFAILSATGFSVSYGRRIPTGSYAKQLQKQRIIDELEIGTNGSTADQPPRGRRILHPDNKPIAGEYIRKNDVILSIPNNDCTDSLWVWLWAQGWRNDFPTEDELAKYLAPATTFSVFQHGAGKAEWIDTEHSILQMNQSESNDE